MPKKKTIDAIVAANVGNTERETSNKSSIKKMGTENTTASQRTDIYNWLYRERF